MTDAGENLGELKLQREALSALRAERISRIKHVEVKKTRILTSAENKEPAKAAADLADESKIGANVMSKEDWELYNVFFKELREASDFKDLLSHAAFLRFGKQMTYGEMSEDKQCAVLKDIWEAEAAVFARRDTSDEYRDYVPLKRQMLALLKELNSY